MTATSTPMAGAAQAYAERFGWPVIPLHSPTDSPTGCDCRKPDCQSPAKHPRTAHGLDDATTDPEQIRRWWEMWPEANIGIPTGPASGLLVVDIDPAHGGDETIRDLQAGHGELALTPQQATGGGGRHYAFSYPDATIRNSAGKLGPGVDVRGDGGYIVAAPSRHASGGEYAWAAGAHPSDTPLAPPPDWLLEKLRTAEHAPASAVDGGIPEGKRNDTLASLAGTMRRRGMSESSILAALLEENTVRCNPPLAEDEVSQIAHSVGRYAPAPEPDPLMTTSSHPGGADPNSGQHVRSYRLTDTGNAERFVAQHGDDVRYDFTASGWFIYDGMRWRGDDVGHVIELAKQTARSIYADVAGEPDPKQRRALSKWAAASESDSKVKALLSLARSSVPVRRHELDADPWLLNVLNGTLDLRTAELRGHDRDDLITKLAPVEYEAEKNQHDAESFPDTGWERFVEQAAPDPELRAFLQRACGYALTGDTGEQVLFFIHGPTASMKSTFLEAVKATMGDYALTADFDTFLARRDVGRPRNDIARLAGSHMVVSIEVEEGKRLAESLVKMLTGGDTVSARKLYQEAFEFRPTFKLFLAANDTPRIRDSDAALWRRIRRIPFEQSLPLEKRDPQVKARLTDTALSGPAILKWLVEGCLAWQRDGLHAPDAVRQATEDLRAEMDPLGQWIEDSCVLDAGAWTPASDLRRSYERWCEQNGEQAANNTQFGSTLGARGYSAEKRQHGGRRVRGRAGIGVLSSENSTAADGLSDSADGSDTRFRNFPLNPPAKAELRGTVSNPSGPSGPSAAERHEYAGGCGELVAGTVHKCSICAAVAVPVNSVSAEEAASLNAAFGEGDG